MLFRSALRQLMLERPLKKITVQDLMDRTQMKRQTFYYHFQDIYDVLVWICRRQLVEPLERPDYEDGIIAAAAEIEQIECIVTRDDDAFRDLGIHCVSPLEFIKERGTEVVAL